MAAPTTRPTQAAADLVGMEVQEQDADQQSRPTKLTREQIGKNTPVLPMMEVLKQSGGARGRSMRRR
jgi:hypothetical protein